MIQGKLSVVLPAHNEVDNLPGVVKRALCILPELTEEFELVIVDDGSRDGTAQLADSLAAENSRVVAVHHARNRGYGAALTSGFAAASGDHIMFMDSDQQFDVADLSYLAPFVGEYDLVAGYRLRRRDALYRLVYAWMFKLVVWLLFGNELRDVDCAFKVFRGDLLRSMTLTSPGALINTEILAKARRAGATWAEIGVHHYPRPSGESSGGSPKVVFRAMTETIRLWLRMRAYVPPSGVTSGCPQKQPRSLVAPMLAAVAGLAVAVAAIARRRFRT
ncbi:MAG TPA: glycosyltransferase family 2 protein [Thermomicrobiaceae bacterium]|nr:glycosyltransferase family 2 protein [Thermomicrobiaceae bacterium]